MNGNRNGNGSAKNERICTRCLRPFWAWAEAREKCRQCQPPTKRQTIAMLKRLEMETRQSRQKRKNKTKPARGLATEMRR